MTGCCGPFHFDLIVPSWAERKTTGVEGKGYQVTALSLTHYRAPVQSSMALRTPSLMYPPQLLASFSLSLSLSLCVCVFCAVISDAHTT